MAQPTQKPTFNQPCNKTLPQQRKAHIPQLLNDMPISTMKVSDLLDNVRLSFTFCIQFHISLQLEQCLLFTSSVRWCGCFISSDAISFDPLRLDSLLNMSPPLTGAHLQQVVCSLQWVRTGIPNFTTIVRPLQYCLELVYAAAHAKQTLQDIERIMLSSVCWKTEESYALHK